MKVLVAEDDEGVREGLSDLLEERAAVVAVATVNDALSALGGDRFDLVVADMRLGGEPAGGRTVLERARARGAPVVVMTGLSERDMRRTLGDFVPDGLLPKPFAIDDALALLDRFLADRKA